MYAMKRDAILLLRAARPASYGGICLVGIGKVVLSCDPILGWMSLIFGFPIFTFGLILFGISCFKLYKSNKL